jgi:hypothetical protein
MTRELRPARTDTFEHTITGLMRKRAELLGEVQRCRDRLAKAENAIESIDRVLKCLGHAGSVSDMKPIGTRNLMFDRHGLSRFVLDEVRAAEGPVTSRDLAVKLIILDGRDPLDNSLVSDIVKRVGRVLRNLRRDGVVTGAYDKVRLKHWSKTASR